MPDSEILDAQQIQQAEEHLEQKQYIEAIDKLQNISSDSPLLYSRALILMAEGFSTLGFRDIAAEMVQKIDLNTDIENERARAEILYKTADFCRREGLNEAALARYREVRRIDPSFRDIDKKLHDLKEKTGMWDGAAERLVINSRYTNIREIARGGMGVVFCAWDTSRNREVAIKVIDFRYRRDIEARQRFMKEAGVALKFVHPNIVRVLGVENPENPYIVMEFVQGESLRDILDRRGRLSPKRIHKYVVQIVRALEYAHYHEIIHRDLKPGNLIVTVEDSITILDFGLAKILGLTTVTRQGTVIGTPYYMSPEQGKGELVDARSDIYSLGVIVFEMTAGRRPFVGDNIMHKHVGMEPPALGTMAPGIPEWLENLVSRCLEKDPQDRFQSCTELLKQLVEQVGEPPAGPIDDEEPVPTEEYK
ncbi:MAG: serine/threonine-protein kinase [bacterium]|nr:serine/threonine-protein kinase [bacterium]